MGDTDAYEYFMENYLTELIPENGNAGREQRFSVDSGEPECTRYFLRGEMMPGYIILT